MLLKNIQAFWFPSYVHFNLNYIIIFILFLFLYSITILYLLTYLFKNKQIKNNNIEYISIIKDKEFILFKSYLFNLYYIFTIIFTIYLLKNNYFIFFIKL